MKTYPKKRIEIIIEALLMRRVLDRLRAASVTGYSVLPVLAGAGHFGEWSAAGQISDTNRMVAIVCIVDGAKANDVLRAAFEIVTDQIGIVTMSDVDVVRPEHF